MYLLIGSKGLDVKHLQEALNALSLSTNSLKIDGIFGQQTKARVMAFQRSIGLKPDGIVGPLTGKALLASVCLCLIPEHSALKRHPQLARFRMHSLA